jgi:hypothetical protein
MQLRRKRRTAEMVRYGNLGQVGALEAPRPNPALEEAPYRPLKLFGGLLGLEIIERPVQ